MAVNKKAIEKILSDLYQNGLYISLHDSEPASSGSPMIYGPALIPRGALRASNGMLQNTRAITLDSADSGGRARHIGLWISKSLFLASVKLPSQVIILPDSEIQIPTNSFRFSLSNV